MVEQLVVEGLTARRGRRLVLDHVDLQVSSGESLAVRGPSGVGKTTLLWCVAGLHSPDSGRISFAGRTVFPSSARARRSFRRAHVGMVLQGGELVPELSATENVVLGALLAGLSARDARTAARVALDRARVPAVLTDQSAATLSGGERQRVAIARALVHQPDLVLADEPTAALDDDNAVATAELLAALPRETGCALVVVTHDDRVSVRTDAVLSLSAPPVAP